MTFADTGSFLFSDSAPMPVDNQGIGDLLLVEVYNYDDSTSYCDGLSGGGATWEMLGTPFAGTVNAQYVTLFAGTVTATGAGSVTPSWSSTPPSNYEINGHEFTSTTGSWVLDVQGNLDSAGTYDFVSLTPAASGELYFGAAGFTESGAVPASTAGYVYSVNANSDGVAYDVSCPSGVATAPAWAAPFAAFGLMALIAEVTAAIPPVPAALPVPAPGWFPGADGRVSVPGTVPFTALPPAAPLPASYVAPAATPGGAGSMPVLRAPGWFPGADGTAATPGAIPFTVPPPELPPPPAPQPPFLTGIAGSGTGQYFTDQYGAPYLIRWDSVWGLIAQAGSAGAPVTWQSDMTGYCAARSAEGFNGFITTPTSSGQVTGNAADGDTWDGVAPFSAPGVLNDTFWQRVDYLLSTAASYGLTVLLDAVMTYATVSGGCLSGWTTTQYQAYGAALASRYAGTPNLVWHTGDDYNEAPGATLTDADLTAWLAGVRGTGDTRLVSIENAAESTSRKSLDGSTTYSWGTANAQYNYCYTYNTGYDAVEIAYQEASPLAVCQMDGWYDNDSGEGGTTEPPELFMRKLVWWALSSGSRGYQYGNADLWYWPADALASGLVSASPGDLYMQPAALNTILDTFAGLAGWHQLVPDTSSALVTAGRGTHATVFSRGGGGGTYEGGDTYVSASITADGTLAVIYLPAADTQTITVNGSLMQARYTAAWVDPASGAASDAGISSSYTQSAANSAGDNDWLLVLLAPAAPVTPVVVCAAPPAPLALQQVPPQVITALMQAAIPVSLADAGAAADWSYADGSRTDCAGGADAVTVSVSAVLADEGAAEEYSAADGMRQDQAAAADALSLTAAVPLGDAAGALDTFNAGSPYVYEQAAAADALASAVTSAAPAVIAGPAQPLPPQPAIAPQVIGSYGTTAAVSLADAAGAAEQQYADGSRPDAAGAADALGASAAVALADIAAAAELAPATVPDSAGAVESLAVTAGAVQPEAAAAAERVAADVSGAAWPDAAGASEEFTALSSTADTGHVRWAATPLRPRWKAVPLWHATGGPMFMFEPMAAASLEFLNMLWTAELAGTEIDPTGQTSGQPQLEVQFAVPLSSGDPLAPAEPETWFSASWLTGTNIRGYVAQGSLGPSPAPFQMTAGLSYDAWSRILGTPESPVKFCGTVSAF